MIELTDDPRDYGLPHGFNEWYPNQRDVCERAVNLEEDKVFIVEMPTSGGKSMIPIIVSYFRPHATVCVGSRDLQSQYEVSTPDLAKTVWGREHYDCENPTHIADFRQVYGPGRVTRLDCPYSKPKDCDHFPCAYERQKIDASHARVQVFNYDYAYWARWWLKNVNDLFCDECHDLPFKLSDLVSVEVSEGRRRKYGLPHFPLAIGHAPYAVKKALRWCEGSASALLPSTKSKDIKRRNAAVRLSGELEALTTALQIADTPWHIESREGKGFSAKPVFPGKFASHLLTPHARSIILMSATVGDPQVLATTLGIESFEFVSYPSAIPVENRPVTLLKSAPKLTYRSTESEYHHQIELIKKLLRDRPGAKTVIHTASWRHCKNIAAAISREGREIIVPDAGARLESIERFKNAEDGAVAVSPSWKQGLNFPLDECRLTIIAKVPFKTWNDPVIQMQVKSKGGRAFYDWDASLQVVQACGRGVRSPEDYCESFILDTAWRRVSRRAPKWFEWQEI